MKIVLLFPPAGNFTQPYISLPALTAFMRQAGHTVVQRDIAIEAIEDLINARRLRRSMQKVAARVKNLAARPRLTPQEAAECQGLEKVNASASYIVEHIDEAKRVLRDPTQILTRHSWAFEVVNRGLELLSAEYWPSIWTVATFSMPDYTSTISDMLAAGGDEQRNIFYAYFEEKVVPSLLAEEPDIVGISCSYFGQILASLTLIQVLKRARPGLHVCVGGAVIANLAPVLQKDPRLFSLVDSIVTGEGEHALLRLAEVLSGDGDLSQVPNLMYLDDGRVRSTDLYVEDVNALPTPDYTGLPLELYLTPELEALLATDRGCYWHRCAFCIISSTMHCRYRPRDISLVVEDMKKLHQQLGTRCFFLSNDAVPPKRMKALAQTIIEEGLDFYWQTEARLEKALTPDACRLLAKGGCRRLMFGVEAGSQRILDLMDKGTQVTDLSRLLRNCHEAGIAIITFLMIGFPTETREEARETMAFVEANHEVIMTLVLQAFSLYPGSKVYANPDAYGVTKWQPMDPLSLDRTVREPQYSSGMTEEDVLKGALPEAYRRLRKIFPAVRMVRKVVTANRIPNFDSFEKPYMAWLAQHGVKHYREVPAVARQLPAPVDPDDVSNKVVAFAAGVECQNVNGLSLTLFNPQTTKVLTLSPATQELLQLYDGRSTVRQVAGRFADNTQGTGHLKRYYQAIKFSHLLVERGFLVASANGSELR